MEQTTPIFSTLHTLDMTHSSSGEQTDFTQLALMVGKSLVTSGKDGLSVDIQRFREEIKLWRFYRKGNTACLFLSRENCDDKEGNGFVSILPVILGNEKVFFQRKAMVSFLLDTRQSLGTVFAGLLLGRLLIEKKQKELNTEQKVLELFKDELIHLSFDEFFSDHPKNLRIPFEKEKIRWIQMVDRIPGSYHRPLDKNHLTSEEIFLRGIDWFIQRMNPAIFQQRIPESRKESEGEYSGCENGLPEAKILGDFIDGYGRRNHKQSSEGDDFLRSMDQYFEKLRKFRIQKDPLDLQQCCGENWVETNGIFTLKKGEKRQHCLLGPFVVLEEHSTEHEIHMLVKNKSGMMQLKKPLK